MQKHLLAIQILIVVFECIYRYCNTSTMFIRSSWILGELHRFVSCIKLYPNSCTDLRCHKSLTKSITVFTTENPWKLSWARPAVPILFASRSTFQDGNSSRSTIVAHKPKERMCIFGCFYLTIFFKLLVFYRIARSQIIYRILNSLLMTAVLTMEGI